MTTGWRAFAFGGGCLGFRGIVNRPWTRADLGPEQFQEHWRTGEVWAMCAISLTTACGYGDKYPDVESVPCPEGSGGGLLACGIRSFTTLAGLQQSRWRAREGRAFVTEIEVLGVTLPRAEHQRSAGARVLRVVAFAADIERAARIAARWGVPVESLEDVT